MMTSHRRSVAAVAATLFLLSLLAPHLRAADAPPPRPNILYILCDDLGYGDVHALNPTRGKIPNLKNARDFDLIETRASEMVA